MTARTRRTDRACREDGDLSFVAAQLSADGLWAWPLLSAFTRMALEWVGRGGFVHVSDAPGGCAGRVGLRTGKAFPTFVHGKSGAVLTTRS
ncbi:hypothetical protein GCM10010298_27450 [Streptomyces microflavus]|nr:hypothetical protein GCM10010298_27450 [Streptomyces microflavus]